MRATSFVLGLLLLNAVLFGLGTLVPPIEVFYEILNSLVTAIAFGVALGFSQAASKVIQTPPLEYQPGDVLIVGIFLVWSGILITFAFLWGFRVTDDPWYITNGYAAFGRWLIVVGGCFHLAASGAIENRIPRRALMRIGIVVAAATFVALVMVSYGVGLHDGRSPQPPAPVGGPSESP
jgi:hypothetical protein